MKKEVRRFLESYPETKYIDAFIIDLCGNAVGKRYPVGHLEKIYSADTLLCAGTYLLDITGNTSDPLGIGFSDGDPDADAYPVPGSLKPIPWTTEAAGQCLLTLKNAGTKNPVWFEPRNVLEKVVQRFDELKLRPVVAVELEFYLLDALRTPDGFPQPPINPRSGERTQLGKVFGFDELEDFKLVLHGIDAACSVQGIPASTSLSEYGPGQFEVNLEHTDNPLKAADDAALLRRVVQQVSRRAGFDATFLSKPYMEQSGSGMHIHVSVLDPDGGNIFDPHVGQKNDNIGFAIAGLQASMAEAMGIFSPSINGFRRFAPNQYVPVTKDWGENNRSVAFRLPAGKSNNRRIEHRVAGADANPYLVMAAVLAGMHYGFNSKPKTTTQHRGNAGTEVDASLPMNLWDALDCMQEAKILNEYLGADYLEAYISVKRAEFKAFMQQPTKQEFDWYL